MRPPPVERNETMPIFSTKAIHQNDLPITSKEFICADCVNSGLYTEDGFMGHYAITCKLLNYKHGEYEMIVEPDSPNTDGTLDFVNECDSYQKDEHAIYKHLLWFDETKWKKQEPQ